MKKSYLKKLYNNCIMRLLVIFIIICTLTGCNVSDATGDAYKAFSDAYTLENENKKSEDLEDKLIVHYIDVGQGSSTLIEIDSHYMLIDGGDRAYSSTVVTYLKNLKIQKLDYVIVTHYDADHLNGVVGALNVYDADVLFAPDYEADSKIYASFKELIKKKGIEPLNPVVGAKYEIGDAEFTILAPNDTHYSDANDYSIAIKLEYGDTSFVFTGDAETESEYEMLENGIDVSCNVYLAGHHGSKYSSSQAFMQATKPEYVVISVGKDNKYGHPAEEALARFAAMGCTVYRTDECGDIIAESDGRNITFRASKKRNINDKKTINDNSNDTDSTNNTKGKYIGNVKSKKYHLEDCGSLPDEANRIYFKSKKEAKDAGYSACGNCEP